MNKISHAVQYRFNWPKVMKYVSLLPLTKQDLLKVAGTPRPTFHSWFSCYSQHFLRNYSGIKCKCSHLLVQLVQSHSPSSPFPTSREFILSGPPTLPSFCTSGILLSPFFSQRSTFWMPVTCNPADGRRPTGNPVYFFLKIHPGTLSRTPKTPLRELQKYVVKTFENTLRRPRKHVAGSFGKSCSWKIQQPLPDCVPFSQYWLERSWK